MWQNYTRTFERLEMMSYLKMFIIFLLVSFSCTTMMEWQNLLRENESDQDSREENLTCNIQWKPPKENWIKINVDATVSREDNII